MVKKDGTEMETEKEQAIADHFNQFFVKTAEKVSRVLASERYNFNYYLKR